MYSHKYKVLPLTLVLLVADLDKTKLFEKKVENDWNPSTFVLIWEYSARAPMNTNMTGFR